MRQRESAICVHVGDYGETSQVVHFLTRGWGLVRLLAKGAKRPKSSTGGAVDLLCEGDLVFIASSRMSLGTLVEFKETISHADLRTAGGPLNAALYMIELAGKMLAESDPHPEVFDLLHNGLARLGQAGAPVQAVLAYFQWRLLRHTGLMGEMNKCVACGKIVASADGKSAPARDVYFTSSQGGLLCGGCEASFAEKFRLDGQTLAGLAALAAAEAGAKVSLPVRQAAAVNRLLAYHTEQQLGKPLKMTRHAIGV